MFGCLLVRCSYLIVRMAAHFCIPTIATRGVHNDIVRTDCKRHAMLLGSPRTKLKLKHRAMQRCNNSALYQKDQPPPSLNPAIKPSWHGHIGHTYLASVVEGILTRALGDALGPGPKTFC